MITSFFGGMEGEKCRKRRVIFPLGWIFLIEKEKENFFFIEEFTVWLFIKFYLSVSRYIILSSYEISFGFNR